MVILYFCKVEQFQRLPALVYQFDKVKGGFRGNHVFFPPNLRPSIAMDVRLHP